MPRQTRRMVLMRMPPAWGDEAHQVTGPAALFQCRDEADESRPRGDRAVLDGIADPHQFLLDDAAGADGQMADLGVAHLPVRQSDRAAGGVEERVRAA